MAQKNPTNERMFHLSLNVSNLDHSVEFYTKALGIAPVKRHADYAKFELNNPPLVLSLEPGLSESQEKLNHLGIRVSDGEALRTFAESAHSSGLEPQYIQGVECCYSRQTKLCLNDPDGNLVEFYVLEADLENDSKKQQIDQRSVTSQTQTTNQVWDHMLGTPFQNPIPVQSKSLDEVRLRGTFNIKIAPEDSAKILSEVKRALTPGGQLMLHLLVSDVLIHTTLPRLPGPAALVEHTPTESEIIKALEEAGFNQIELKRLSHSPVFQFAGAKMRELMITANTCRVEATQSNQIVVYRGPFKELTDDTGVRYPRGKRVSVSPSTFAQLNVPNLRDSFVFLNENNTTSCSVETTTSHRETTI